MGYLEKIKDTRLSDGHAGRIGGLDTRLRSSRYKRHIRVPVKVRYSRFYLRYTKAVVVVKN